MNKIKGFELQVRGHRHRRGLIMLAGFLLVAGLALTLLMVGNRIYPLPVVLKVLGGEQIQWAGFAIGTLRLPRMLAGLLVGLSFGMAGGTFQTILRNPLASPDIIGISAGSSAAAVFCILVLKISGIWVSILAVVSGLGVSLLIYLLSRGGSFSGGRLILIGLGVQAMLSAAISSMLLQANQYDIPAAMRWLSGSLNTMAMSQIPPLLVVVLLFGSLILLFHRHLEMLELGEAAARSLGVNTELTRLVLTVSAVFLVAFASAVSGPVAFVAFLSGPIARRLGGSPAIALAGLVGALLVLAADFTGQFLLPVKLPAGVITGMLGAPYLVLLLIRLNASGAAA